MEIGPRLISSFGKPKKKRPEDHMDEHDLYALRLRLRVGKKRRVTQATFAEWLGIKPNTYARTERGELPLRLPTKRLIVYVAAEYGRLPVDRVRAYLEQRRAERNRLLRRK